MLQRVPPLSLFEESPLRRVLVEKLREIPVDAVISFEEMSEVIAGNAQGEGRHYVTSARDALLREGIVYGAVINVGIKRLSNIGAIDATETHLDRSRNAVTRASKTLRACDYEALPPEERQRYGLAQIRVGVMRQFNSVASVRRLKGAVAKGISTANMKAQLSGVLKQFGSVTE